MSKLDVKDWLQIIYVGIMFYGTIIMALLALILIEVAK